MAVGKEQRAAAAGQAAGERAAAGQAAAEKRAAAGKQAAGEPAARQDSVDQHVARWSAFWKDEPSFAPEIEGALVRMNFIQREARRADAAAFAESRELTFEDYKTLHVLMIQ